jgi:hypothetical protein
MKCVRVFLVVALFVTAGVLHAKRAAAQPVTLNGTICLKAWVKTVDDTGKPNDNFLGGPTGSLRVVRGLYISSLARGTKKLTINGAGTNGYADGDGCFTWTCVGDPECLSASWTLNVRSKGSLMEGNTVLVFDPETEETAQYSVATTLTSNGIKDVELPYKARLNIYTIMAYIINEKFRGNYENERLDVYAGDKGHPTCYGNGEIDAYYTGQFTNGRICIAVRDEAGEALPYPQRKYSIIGHEYGHANLAQAISPTGQLPNVSCDLSGSGHDWSSLEYNSCAFSEAWGNFVAADSFNGDSHQGGTRDGWFPHTLPLAFFPSPINLENPSGGCPPAGRVFTGESAPIGYGIYSPTSYADQCYAGHVNCPTGNCDGVGVEIAYTRMLYDYHTDGLPPVAPDLIGHDELQEEVQAALAPPGWNAINFYDRWRDSVDAWHFGAFMNAAVSNGVNEP